jgi:hypothetical protein
MSLPTRVGHIGPTDNRFLGRSVFGQLHREITGPSDLLSLTLGARLGEVEREALRLVALCATSPDARVWPLKLCRLLSSHGDPIAGCFGAQLISAGSIMGPGTAAGAAAGLRFVAERLEAEPQPDEEAVARATADWCARNGNRFQGFGVPFRPEDERLLAMRRFVAGGALEKGPHWQLQQRVAAAIWRQCALPPNVALGAAALLLDAGIPAHRCGAALALLMSPLFVAHALEAAERDGANLHSLPPSSVDFRGADPRHSAERRTASALPPALARQPRSPLDSRSEAEAAAGYLPR